MGLPRQQQFSRTPRAVGRARTFVAGLFAGWDPPERADDVLACISELATNAVVHGPRGRDFLVRVCLRGGIVRVEVHDAGDDAPCLRAPADTDENGRGLLLVDALADDWGVSDRTGPGKAVWAEFKLAAVRSAVTG